MKQLSLTLFKNEELIGILLTCLLASVLVLLFFRYAPIHWPVNRKEKKENTSLPFLKPTKPNKKWTKRDWLYVTLITVNYAIISLWNLGSTVLPTTTWQPSFSTQTIILELTNDTHFDSFYAIFAEGDNNSNLTSLQFGWNSIIVEGSNDQSTWEEITTLDSGSYYQYKITSGDFDYRYVRLISTNINNTLTEVAFKAYGEEELLKVKVIYDEAPDGSYPATMIIDEQEKVVLDPTYYDESYFDEVYHPRNAWEIANQQFMYATVHPLLGTTIIALSIKIFGMNPFAWRLPGAITGILLIPLFYAILKRLFDKRLLCIFGIVLLASDFMHLTTSRIATLEPFSVFWILLMFKFMIDYCYTSFYDTPLKKTLQTLLFCGISMGLGIATKWTACYSAVGLAILLFTTLIQRCIEYRKAKAILESEEENLASYNEEQNALLHKINDTFPKYFWTTIAWCFVFFIFIPIIIYWASYIVTPVWRDGWSISNVWSQNVYMYNYHSNLNATHPYQSTWKQWLLDLRPIWYYGRQARNGIYHSIACFSNPVICWAGLISIVVVFIVTALKRNMKTWIISVGYLTAFLPWVLLVDRCVFAYHFYPTSFFMILAIVYCASLLLKINKENRHFVYAFMIISVVIFIMFLPATAGHGTTNAYIKFLEWLPNWYFG